MTKLDTFVRAYTNHLDKLTGKEGVADIHRWFWHQHKHGTIRSVVKEINQICGLKGTNKELKPDLPTLSSGSQENLLIVAANPGWNETTNQKENDYCRKSVGNYLGFRRDFFEIYKHKVGKRSRWWSGAMSYIELLELLPEARARVEEFKSARGAEERWKKAHERMLIGGWELIPFHSASDGLTKFAYPRRLEHLWISKCAKAAIEAAIRINPHILMVASNAGWRLMRLQLHPEWPWRDKTPKRRGPTISYCQPDAAKRRPMVIAVDRQLCTHGAPTCEEIRRAIEGWRKK